MTNILMTARAKEEQQSESNKSKNKGYQRPDLWGVWISIKGLYRLEFNHTMSMR